MSEFEVKKSILDQLGWRVDDHVNKHVKRIVQAERKYETVYNEAHNVWKRNGSKPTDEQRSEYCNAYNAVMRVARDATEIQHSSDNSWVLHQSLGGRNSELMQLRWRMEGLVREAMEKAHDFAKRWGTMTGGGMDLSLGKGVFKQKEDSTEQGPIDMPYGDSPPEWTRESSPPDWTCDNDFVCGW
ncbi:hypothetical protein BDV96DRAFT_653126 [Lophiotrema nucula]|uniref:Uncharacterized protein n=1 Tax=Lophiotrema nucula TaxID=690887 RepID=A0A6A5YPB8_9PLEO|nr:hypothetical protein BDV96DRAFT_653126 [Lophiotrema nucula]